MRVLVLTPSLYDTAPGARFRIEQWARYLEGEGFQFTFVPFESEALHTVLYEPGHYAAKVALMTAALARRLRTLHSVRRFDVVFLYREASLIGPAFIERLIAGTGVPIVYDFDDPIWLPYLSPTNPFFSRFKCVGKTSLICGLSRTVIAGNRLLADWARGHAGHVEVVPSTIDLKSYPLAEKAERPPTVTLGWTGSHSTLPFLEPIRGVLKRLADAHRFRLVIISHTDRTLLDDLPVEVVGKKWNAATEAADLLGIDIGLAPFPDSGWTPWRCHGKVLQYMAAAIPTVTSGIGILPDYIRDGDNGFLATSDEEWFQKLSALIADPGLRRRVGLSGRRTVEERYSAQAWVPKVREILAGARA